MKTAINTDSASSRHVLLTDREFSEPTGKVLRNDVETELELSTGIVQVLVSFNTEQHRTPLD
jgi:hypothetical protein